MKRAFPVLCVLVMSAVLLCGCEGMFPEPPEAKPDMPGIDVEAARLIDGVQRGIRMRSFGLPTRRALCSPHGGRLPPDVREV